MKVPLNWLNDYVDVGGRSEELMDKLTAIGHLQDGPPQQIAGDQVYDLEVRQNRSDVLSLLGVAREAAAALDTELKTPDIYLSALPEENGPTQVTIETPELCYRFNTITIDGLTVGQSPEWLTQKLEAMGIKSVNNVVDITNFVMIELGQPLHAFDFKKVTDQHLFIRSAREGEALVVLGGKKVRLTTDDLVIADSQQALALAGVMGGEGSGVSPATNSIILEAATYNQASIRRSTLRHTLRTESSTRLEKFLHPHLTELALLRASHLIIELCGGEVTGHRDAYPNPKPETTVTLTQEYLNRIAGISFTMQQAQDLLAKLFISTELKSDNELLVRVPYFRTDLEQEADIVEEVIRIHGYDNLPSRLPSNPPPKSIQSAAYDLGEKVRDYFTSIGYDEQITEPLTKEEESALEPVYLENSLSSEKVMLRTSLRPMLEQGLSYRRKYRQESIKLFEVGRIYFKENDQYLEKHTVGFLLADKNANYQKIKGVAEGLLIRLGYAPDDSVYTITAINEQVFVVELDLDSLLKRPTIETQHVLTSPPQLILQDLSISVPTETRVGDMINQIKQADPLIYSVELGEPPFKTGDRKNVFLHLAYHDPERTISTDDIQPAREEVIRILTSQFSAKLR